MASNLRKLLPSGLLVVGISVPVLLAVEATHQPACDRTCLLSITSDYVDALVSHNPSSLKLAADLQSTENGKPVPIGEGLWKTAKAVPVRESFADASTGEAGLFGLVTEENGQRFRLALHLKVNQQRIQQVEMLVSPEVRPSE